MIQFMSKKIIKAVTTNPFLGGNVQGFFFPTRGHYMADVCDAKTGKWYRTSDDNFPSEIKSVSDSGYIFLLKKV